MMEIAIQMAVKVLTVLLCGFILAISMLSHISLKSDNIASTKEMIRRSAKATVGGRVFFYCIMLFCLNGFIWGLTSFTYTFLFAAILAERLIVYRVCRGKKDRLGKLLVRINW